MIRDRHPAYIAGLMNWKGSSSRFFLAVWLGSGLALAGAPALKKTIPGYNIDGWVEAKVAFPGSASTRYLNGTLFLASLKNRPSKVSVFFRPDVRPSRGQTELPGLAGPVTEYLDYKSASRFALEGEDGTAIEATGLLVKLNLILSFDESETEYRIASATGEYQYLRFPGLTTPQPMEKVVGTRKPPTGKSRVAAEKTGCIRKLLGCIWNGFQD